MISGKNRSGKSNILFAIVYILLGTNLTGDEKACLINKKCNVSYGELHFTDNQGKKHILIRSKDRFDSRNNYIALDGKPITQAELISFYKDKKLLLSIINPGYFLNKKPAEQKEMIDKYLSDIRPKYIFDGLSKNQQDNLLDKYFYISIKDIYDRLKIEDLEDIYIQNNLQNIIGIEFKKLTSDERKDIFYKNIKYIKNRKYYEILTSKEKSEFINLNMTNIFLDIAYENLSKEEQNILEGIPRDIPVYISELNGDIKRSEEVIASLQGKIEYAKKIVEDKPEKQKVFEKEEELKLAKQELSFLNTNQDIVDKEKQKRIVENLEKEILSKETEYKELERTMKEGKKKYLSIKEGESSICPICNQHIENESKIITIENMRKELIADYEKSNILETQIKDLKIKSSMEKCKFHSYEGNTTIEKSKRISVIEENIRQLEDEKLKVEKFNQDIATKEQLIKKAKTDILNLEKEKQSHLRCIENINIAKKVAQKLYISYIEEKMKLAKKYLKDVNIKFYSVLKSTGEIKDDFIINYKDTPLQNLSKSETVATGLEFANMFNQLGRTNFPFFIDDMESCLDYDFIKDYSNNNQLIISKVEKGTRLKIADYYNSNNYTIIKPFINGCKTINLDITNIQKAA